MTFFSQHRTLMLAALGVLLALGVWWMFAPEDAPATLISTENVAAESDAERGLVDTLLTLRAVTLSGAIFLEPAFATLQDFGTEIVAEPIGRPNPFAPLSQRATTTPRSARVFDRR